jgi:hypothetical protein
VLSKALALEHSRNNLPFCLFYSEANFPTLSCCTLHYAGLFPRRLARALLLKDISASPVTRINNTEKSKQVFYTKCCLITIQKFDIMCPKKTELLIPLNSDSMQDLYTGLLSCSVTKESERSDKLFDQLEDLLKRLFQFLA